MVALIIIILAAILFMCNIITHSTFGLIALLSIFWAGIGAVLYFKVGWFKFFYHDFLGWHTPDNSPRSFDGLSEHATCKYCGKDIMQDSHGNWFC